LRPNIFAPPQIRFVPINTATFDIVAGVAGYIDTDVSATTGVDTRRAWLVAIICGAALTAAARAHGTAESPAVTVNNSVTVLSHVDSAGHMDLYRNAGGDLHYWILGYLDAV